MTKRCEKLLEKAERTPHALRFSELQRLAECFGYEYDRTAGSHHIYKHSKARAVLNIQPDRGNAKTYQVRQLLDQVDELGLSL